MFASTNRFSDDYDINSETGVKTEEYEIKVADKLGRGLKNFFLSNLEVTHNIQTEIQKRRENQLPVQPQTFLVGLSRGIMFRMARSGVGLYEIVTCPFPQKPIMKEIDEWV